MPQIINGVLCRSKIESLQHIIDQAKQGKIGPNIDKGDFPNCTYQYPSGNHCAVGSLFSQAQLEAITAENEWSESHNEESVGNLAIVFGETNIETVTGMTIEELGTIQRAHDNALSAGFGTAQERVQKARQGVVAQATAMLARATVQV
jgi:hypothetical protein